MAQSTKQGNFTKRSGRFLLITGILLGIILRFVPDSDMNEFFIIIGFIPLIMIFGGAFLSWRGRQYAARAVAQEVLHDAKPDVLYLRAFKTDPSTAGSVFSSILTPVIISGMATEEEQLREVLQPFGDLVAIGKPGESLPTPGAARLYASDEEWQKVVSDQMRAARLVVIRAGKGEGLMWEIEQAVKLVSPEKLLILILKMPKKHYRAFCLEGNRIFKGELPVAGEVKRFGHVSGFLRFGNNWQMEFLQLRTPYFRTSVYKPLRRLFQHALRPVFEQSGLPWQPPGVSILTVSAVTMLASFGLLICIAIVSSL